MSQRVYISIPKKTSKTIIAESGNSDVILSSINLIDTKNILSQPTNTEGKKTQSNSDIIPTVKSTIDNPFFHLWLIKAKAKIREGKEKREGLGTINPTTRNEPITTINSVEENTKETAKSTKTPSNSILNSDINIKDSELKNNKEIENKHEGKSATLTQIITLSTPQILEDYVLDLETRINDHLLTLKIHNDLSLSNYDFTHMLEHIRIPLKYPTRYQPVTLKGLSNYKHFTPNREL